MSWKERASKKERFGKNVKGSVWALELLPFLFQSRKYACAGRLP
jgi:hypothetical protein